MIKAIAKLVLALNGNVKKSQLAAGFAWGLLLGLIPMGNFFWVVLFVGSFFFRHNHAAKLLSMAVLKILSPVFAPLVDQLGWAILHIEVLQPMFTGWYNMPFVPFTKFNNTLVAGGLVGGAVLWLPAFALFMALIPLYRSTIGVKLANSKILRVIGKFPLFTAIEKALKAGG